MSTIDKETRTLFLKGTSVQVDKYAVPSCALCHQEPYLIKASPLLFHHPENCREEVKPLRSYTFEQWWKFVAENTPCIFCHSTPKEDYLQQREAVLAGKVKQKLHHWEELYGLSVWLDGAEHGDEWTHICTDGRHSQEFKLREWFFSNRTLFDFTCMEQGLDLMLARWDEEIETFGAQTLEEREYCRERIKDGKPPYRYGTKTETLKRTTQWTIDDEE